MKTNTGYKEGAGIFFQNPLTPNREQRRHPFGKVPGHGFGKHKINYK